MLVPLTICDFVDRATQVFPERIGIVDEPDQPAGGLGDLTYRRVAELAVAQAAALDKLGIGVGERIAIVSQNSARLLLALYGMAGSGRVVVPINFRLSAAEISYIVEHSGASLLLIDPELAESLAAV
jgi:fatty-acyl-CoA synthase